MMEGIEPLNLSDIREIDLVKVHGNKYNYHYIERFLKIECKECSNIFYQDIYYHLHGGECLFCSLHKFLTSLNPE